MANLAFCTIDEILLKISSEPNSQLPILSDTKQIICEPKYRNLFGSKLSLYQFIAIFDTLNFKKTKCVNCSLPRSFSNSSKCYFCTVELKDKIKISQQEILSHIVKDVNIVNEKSEIINRQPDNEKDLLIFLVYNNKGGYYLLQNAKLIIKITDKIKLRQLSTDGTILIGDHQKELNSYF